MTRVGLLVEGRTGLLFVNAKHVASIPQPTTDADRVALEIGLGAIALTK